MVIGSMDNNTQDLALRLPLEPYPGLRPFLDHEAMLLLGRGRQVREVIARLRETRFVAVIGGSGSGKSSLIRAGVVPELRGFGIPDAGDYWVPVVCTPGTTKTEVTADEPAVVAMVPGATPVTTPVAPQTPITRLAWKFSKELDPAQAVIARRVAAHEIEPCEQPVDEAAEAALRRDDIAGMFRQGAGFARLVKAYSEELPAVGPQREKAHFLFVIDQFEELFHPNNRDNSDAQALVEAVIDHFFNPHPRCFVVLTMRSEHLADCARYLQLPDAINKSSYLVRRLDDDELREAIVGPAKYFLRLRRRGEPGAGSSLPDDVVFDDDVIERLLADVRDITDDPDHLPLLQHALARTWESACRRCTNEGQALQVAGRICWADLERAVDPRSQAAPGWLAKETATNSLRQSLENWADAIYDERTPQQQKQLDTVLRHLAFKDPNNGHYTQQRIDVDNPSLFGGVQQPAATLRGLLDHGFLDAVNYLFWDKENPEHVTLKVSHESFIRGWERFRLLVDSDAEHFEEFISVLRRCARWKSDEAPELLLEASELLRFEAADLKQVFADRATRDEWFRVLLQYRDGERLAKMEPLVNAFVDASRARLAAEEKKRLDAAERERVAVERQRELESQRLADQVKFDAERRGAQAENLAARAEAERFKAEMARAEAVALAADSEVARAEAESQRNRLVLFVVLPILVFTLLSTAFWWYAQTPVLRGVDKFTNARMLTERRPSELVFAGAAGRALGELVEASESVDQAKSAAGRVVGSSFMHWLAGWFGPAAEMQRLFANTSSEPLVNGSMRALLTTQVWRSTTEPQNIAKAAMFLPLRSERKCSVADAFGIAELRNGSLFFDSEMGRGAFFPTPEPEATEIALHTATLSGDTCIAGREIWSVPLRLKPLLLLDARVRYVAFALTDETAGQPTVSFYKIFWKPGEEGLRPLSVVADREAVRLVQREFEMQAADGKHVNVESVRAARSWREPGGTGVSVAGQSWRLFTDGAQPIEAVPGDEWKELLVPAKGSGCDSLAAALESSPPLQGFVPTTRHQGGFCFAIQRGNTPQPQHAVAPASAASSVAAEQVVVSVYSEPTGEQVSLFERGLPVPVASLTAFDYAAPGPSTWVVGSGGGVRGWIAMRQGTADGGSAYLGSPWSTEALAQLARRVQKVSTLPLSTPIPTPAKSPARTPPASSPPRR